MDVVHQPVLLKEVLEIIDPQPGNNYIDATVNGGGHAQAILERIGSEGQLLGVDWDCDLIELLKKELKFKNLKLVCDNYANIKAVVARNNFGSVAGIIADLGFSSYHLEASGRGFSFLKDEPLDMRYNPQTNELTAAKIVNTWTEEAIADILSRFGEERFAKRIAGGIRRRRPIATTRKLVEVVEQSIPKPYLKGRIHPATRTFQALRITVNGELDNLRRFLPAAAEVLSPGGKLAIISFHSLEDRIVKNFFRDRQKRGETKIINKKPIGAGEEEKENNSRSRSAKLRAAWKI